MSRLSGRLIDRAYDVSMKLREAKAPVSLIAPALVITAPPASLLYTLNRLTHITGNFSHDFQFAAQAGIALGVGVLAQSFGLLSINPKKQFESEAACKAAYAGKARFGLKAAVVGAFGMAAISIGLSYEKSQISPIAISNSPELTR